MILSRLKHFSLLAHHFSRSTTRAQSFRQPKMQQRMDSEEQYQQVVKQLDPASVIKKFRREVLTKSVFNKEEQEMTKLIEDYDKELKEGLKRGSKDEQLAYSRRLIERFVNDKSIFGALTKDPLLSNYGNYSAYKTATLKEEKVKRENWEGTSVEKGYKFLRELGPEYIQNQIIDEHLTESYEDRISVEKYAKNMQVGVNDARMQIERLETTPRAATFQDYLDIQDREYEGVREEEDSEEMTPIFNNEGEESITAFNGENNFGRLSPIAREEIYRCYLDGWTVRDISQRFGIHPRRTKFIVWSRATYYTEVLPKLGFGHFRQVMLEELEYGSRSGFTDYGLDLGFMKEENEHFPSRITVWNNRMTDIRGETDAELERKREQAIQTLQQTGVGAKKGEKVLLGYFGKHNKLSEMRDWKIYRAKGSDYQHTKYTTFRKLFKKTGRETYK